MKSPGIFTTEPHDSQVWCSITVHGFLGIRSQTYNDVIRAIGIIRVIWENCPTLHQKTIRSMEVKCFLSQYLISGGTGSLRARSLDSSPGPMLLNP